MVFLVCGVGLQNAALAGLRERGFTQALERGIPTEASQTQPARGPSDHRA